MKVLLSKLEESMKVENPVVDTVAYKKYLKACDLVRELAPKFQHASFTDAEAKVDWHSIKLSIEDGTAFDGNEVTKLSEMLGCCDYVVFEGKGKLSCAVDNIYSDGNEGKEGK